MAEHTSSSITIEAAPGAVMEVIADFDRYPEWTGEVKEAEVLEEDEAGRAAKVRLLLDAGAIKDEHTLAYEWIGDHEVRWSLVTSQMLRSLDGVYRLAPLDGGERTEATYQLTVDVKIPMLGMIKRKAEKVIIDRALSGLKTRVESGAGADRPAEEDQDQGGRDHGDGDDRDEAGGRAPGSGPAKG